MPSTTTVSGWRGHALRVRSDGGPVRGEAEFFVGPAEAVEEMRRLKRRRAVGEMSAAELRARRVTGTGQGLVD